MFHVEHFPGARPLFRSETRRIVRRTGRVERLFRLFHVVSRPGPDSAEFRAMGWKALQRRAAPAGAQRTPLRARARQFFLRPCAASAAASSGRARKGHSGPKRGRRSAEPRRTGRREAASPFRGEAEVGLIFGLPRGRMLLRLVFWRHHRMQRQGYTARA